MGVEAENRKNRNKEQLKGNNNSVVNFWYVFYDDLSRNLSQDTFPVTRRDPSNPTGYLEYLFKEIINKS